MRTLAALFITATAAAIFPACVEPTPCELAYCSAWCRSRGAECQEINEDGGFTCLVNDPYADVNYGTWDAATDACAP